MVTSFRWPQVGLVFVLILALLHSSEGNCQRIDQIECRSSEQCIYRDALCNTQKDCSDGSDEDSRMCSYWPSKSEHCRNQASSIIYYSGCRTAYYMCKDNTLTNLLPNPGICKFVLQPKLGMTHTGMNMSSEVVALLNSAVNSTLDYKLPDCPMLYTRVGNDCLSFFSPAKVSWAEARQFCISIYGDLWQSKDLATYSRLLEYMNEEKLTSDYWIGGRYDMDTNAWSWPTDDSPMPLGAPFWATKHEASCVKRGPPHTDPYSAPPSALPGARCYHSVLSPKNRQAGWCSAMTYEHFYYWSDEMCDETFSPLCTFTGPAASPQG